MTPLHAEGRPNSSRWGGLFVVRTVFLVPPRRLQHHGANRCHSMMLPSRVPGAGCPGGRPVHNVSEPAERLIAPIFPRRLRSQL